MDVQKSHSIWVRELKLVRAQIPVVAQVVALYMSAWIEIVFAQLEVNCD